MDFDRFIGSTDAAASLRPVVFAPVAWLGADHRRSACGTLSVFRSTSTARLRLGGPLVRFDPVGLSGVVGGYVETVLTGVVG